MRIAGVETVRLEAYPNLIWVQLTTDDGRTGLGETFFGPGAVEAYVHETAAERILGRQASDIEGCLRALRGPMGFGGSGAETRGNSAIDLALHDLLAQQHEISVCRLLGGDVRPLPTYNTCAGPNYGIRKPERGSSDDWGISDASAGRCDDLYRFMHDAGGLADELLGDGFTGMKIWPLDPLGERLGGDIPDAEELTDAMRPLSEIRAAVGDRIDVMLEMHGIWTPEAAKQIAAATKPFKLRWIEDPVWFDDVAGLAAVRGVSHCPVAAGEALGGVADFREMIDRRAVDVVIFDVAWCGGLIEARAIAAAAARQKLTVACHDCMGPVNLCASAALTAALPNAPVQEVCRAFLATWYGELVTNLPTLENGMLMPLDSPGLGTQLRPDVLSGPGVTRVTSE